MNQSFDRLGPTTEEAAERTALVAPGKRTRSERSAVVAPGKRTRTERVYGSLPSAEVHQVAERGLAGTSTPLPFLDRIQASFGRHDVSAVRAHVDQAAGRATEALGARAFARGDRIAFASSPDLRTAAHEAAHVVQQRAGVQLAGGVGQAGDFHEQQADEVADRVVRGESAEALLDRIAGASGRSEAVQFLPAPLWEDGAVAPAHGEDPGRERRYSVEQYVAMREKELGRRLTATERAVIERGCITAVNLNREQQPIEVAEGIYDSFDQAHRMLRLNNDLLEAWSRSGPGAEEAGEGAPRYVLFARLYWANRDEGPVDAGAAPFDYAYWDEGSQSFWHANHGVYGDDRDRTDPMVVVQSSRRALADRGLGDLERVVFCVAKADGFDPALAAVSSAGRGDREAA